MDKLVEIKTIEEFDNIRVGKTIIMFTADWCPDCMFVKPFIGDIVDANPEYKFYMINRDNMIDLCKDLDILGIPSFVAYNDKEEIQAFIDTLK